MSEEADFAALMNRLRQGDQAVAWTIFERFACRLVGLARSRLDSRLRAKVDPEDVVQSALNSFFHRQAEGQFHLESWDNLWSLLTVITLRKCGHRTEHFLAACRDVRRESKPAPPDEDSSANWQAIAREPTPDEATRLTETVERMFRGLPPESRPILSLALEGCSVAEISEQAGRSQRSVYRVLNQVKETLERLSADAAGNAWDTQSRIADPGKRADAVADAEQNSLRVFLASGLGRMDNPLFRNSRPLCSENRPEPP